MKTFLKWLVLAPLIVVALVFAVANRQMVTVVFDPFGNDIPGLSVTMPLFLFEEDPDLRRAWRETPHQVRAAQVRAAQAEEEARRLRMAPANLTPGLPAPLDSRRVA